MKILLLFTFILISNFTFCQINFSNEVSLTDKTHYSSDVTAVNCKDLNNDNTKDLIVASYYDNSIIWYKNIGGDYRNDQRLIITNQLVSPSSVYVNDIDNDGLQDIVACGSGGSIVWYKNLNNNNFSTANTLSTSAESPRSIIAEDIDNDGDNDLIVGLYYNSSVIKYTNTGNGNFQNPTVLYTGTTGTKKVALCDLNNDGFKDVISGHNDGTVYFSLNLTMGNFSQAETIMGSAASGIAFNFLDVNQDGYPDVVMGSEYDDGINYYLNQSGSSFDMGHLITSIHPDAKEVNVKDMDNDGKKDIIFSFSTNDKIGWFKNRGNGNFNSIIPITDNIDNPKAFTVEDINNDGFCDVISSSYNQSDYSKMKVSCFLYKPANNSFTENIINFLPAAVNKVKVADLNNDGLKDIISAYKSIVWNENNGNNSFSSYKLIGSTLVSHNTFTYDIEIYDLDNDNDLDITAITNSSLEVYANQGNESFQLIYSLPLTVLSTEIEISDINGDNYKDILISFGSNAPNLAWIPNLNGVNFGSLTSISFPVYPYTPQQVKCGDIDNDGDNDILTSGSSRIQWLENDGNGNFQYHLIVQSIQTDALLLEDFNNDSFLDIASGGSNSYGPSNLYWIKNGGGGSFLSPQIIHSQSVKSLYCADLNNDNLKDIVGVSYQYYAPYDEKLFYYKNNGSNFGSQVTIDNLGDAVSLTRDVTGGDLNNDNKIDIVTSYYFLGNVSYYLNSSNLEVLDIFAEEETFKIYPVPFSNNLEWNSSAFNGTEVFDIVIYTEDGKNVFQKNNLMSRTINLEFLKRGVYLTHIKYSDKTVVKKIIKK